MNKAQQLQELYKKFSQTMCLMPNATQFVFGRGSPEAQIMLIGEAPGKEEDLTGKPFVGASGKLLSIALLKAGIADDKIYITNAVKSRPPLNRKPTSLEIAQERAMLAQEIAIIQPAVICALGSTAAEALLNLKKPAILKLRDSNPLYLGDLPVVISIHPAFAKRQPASLALLQADLNLCHQIARKKCG